MKINAEWHLDIAVLTLYGRLNFESRREVCASIANMLKSNPRRVIFDLQHVPYVDTAGLALLTIISDDLRQVSTPILLAVPPGYVKDVFTLARVSESIPMVHSVEDVLTSSPESNPCVGSNSFALN